MPFQEHSFSGATCSEPVQSLPPAPVSASQEAELEKPKTIREMAAEHTSLAIQALVDVLNKKEKVSDVAKIAAATALLDRGHGKPTQYVEQTTQIVTYQSLLSDIASKERDYLSIVEAQEVKQISPPSPTKTWADFL